jgi:hypothetical protein
MERAILCKRASKSARGETSADGDDKCLTDKGLVAWVGASAFYCTVKESGEIQQLETTDLEKAKPGVRFREKYSRLRLVSAAGRHEALGVLDEVLDEELHHPLVVHA